MNYSSSNEKEAVLPRIFVSYGHDEYTFFAHRLADLLIENGYEVFIDRDGLTCGKEFDISLENGLKWTKNGQGEGTLILLMTPHSVRRPNGFCLNELAYALDIRLRIIPIMLEQVDPPLSIYRVQYHTLLVKPNDNDVVIANQLNKVIGLLNDGTSLDLTGNIKSLESSLNPIDFNDELIFFTKDFVGRDWLLEHINGMLKRDHQVILVTGGPGIGKTSFSTFLYQRMPDVIGYYMFRRDDNDKLIFKTFISTIAFQISTQIPEYRDFLLKLNLKQLKEQYDGPTLFKKIISEPLSKVSNITGNKILIIDGLDEAERDNRNVIAGTIAMLVSSLPKWFRIIAFTRPVDSVTVPFRSAHKFEVDPNSQENNEDLRTYVSRKLAGSDESVIDSVVKQSDGSFLYAKHACENLGFDDQYDLPFGMANFFYDSFNRIFLTQQEFYNTRHILEFILASTRPVPQKLITLGLGVDMYEIKAFKNKLKSFITVSSENLLRVYHSSLSEWLTDENLSGEYWINVEQAKRRMADLLRQLIIDNLWNFNDLKEYKEKVQTFEEMLGGKVSMNFFPSYIDLLKSLNDHERFAEFAQWYIGEARSTASNVIDMISECQDTFFDELTKSGLNGKINDAWAKQLIYFIENSTTRNVYNDGLNYSNRPETATNYIYFLTFFCLPYLNTSISDKSMEDRLSVVKEAFNHMECDFLKYYSIHEDSICSMYVDEIRERFYEILISGKVSDKNLIEWLKSVSKKP